MAVYFIVKKLSLSIQETKIIETKGLFSFVAFIDSIKLVSKHILSFRACNKHKVCLEVQINFIFHVLVLHHILRKNILNVVVTQDIIVRLLYWQFSV